MAFALQVTNAPAELLDMSSAFLTLHSNFTYCLSSCICGLHQTSAPHTKENAFNSSAVTELWKVVGRCESDRSIFFTIFATGIWNFYKEQSS